MSDWQQACDSIRSAERIVLSTHCNPDGDGIGSQLGLFHTLREAGKQVYMHNRDEVPRIYRFLPGAEHIGWGEHFPQTDIDLIVSLDCGDRMRLGMDKSFFAGATLLNIDHHVSNSHYGDVNLVIGEACSTGAIVLDIMDRLHLPLSAAAASAIYVTVVTDTGSFRLPNTDAGVHRLAARLIEAGAEPWVIAIGVYESFTPARQQLLASCLQTLELCDEGRSAWIYVDDAMYAKHGGDVEDTEGFIEYARAIEGVEVAVFLRPEGNGAWKASFRGKHGADVGALAAGLGGGGHRHAAGCVLDGTLNEVRQRVQRVVSALLH